MHPFWVILIGAACGAVLIFPAIFLLLCILGCTCCGIRGGSAAAGAQSMYHPIESGGCISSMQSVGAGGGCGYCGIVVIILGAAAGAGIGYYITTFDDTDFTVPYFLNATYYNDEYEVPDVLKNITFDTSKIQVPDFLKNISFDTSKIHLPGFLNFTNDW